MIRTIQFYNEEEKRHLVKNNNEKTLCDKNKSDLEQGTYLPSDHTPISFGGVTVCPDCLENWNNSRKNGGFSLEETTKCEHDIVEEKTEEAYQCGKIIPVSSARAVFHNQSNSNYIPVCEDCFNYIRSKNGVEVSYNEATTWKKHTFNKM